MKNPTFSAFKHAIDDINSPKDFDDILRRVGLQRSTTVSTRRMLGWAGFFALGVAAGSTAGLFFAPKRGKELRDQVRDQVRDKLPSGQDRSMPGQDRIYEELN